MGKKYQLTAEANGFPSVKSSIEEIPKKVKISEINKVEDTTGIRLLITFNNQEQQTSFFEIDANAYYGNNNIISSIGNLENTIDNGAD